MKKIQPIPIWNKGQTLEGKVLNVQAVSVTLGLTATFDYQIYCEIVEGVIGHQLLSGKLIMSTEAYLEWGNDDEYVWEWVAGQLSLTITGDYIPPQPPHPEPPVTEPPVTEPTP